MGTRRLYHPLWTHIPALALLGYIVYCFAAAMPLPERVPTHFDIQGNPNAWGSPWVLFAVLVGAGVLWLSMFVLIDELWARQEGRKTFNWIALIDDAVIAFMASTISPSHGVLLPKLSLANSLSWVAGAVLVAALLEHFRQYVPHTDTYRPEDTSRIESEIGGLIEEGKQWVYWESQNPAWMNWIVIATMIYFLFFAYKTFAISIAAAAGFVLLALVMVLLYGGLRVLVTPLYLQVRLGILGIPLLRLQLMDLASVNVHEFSPLRDFGGYGIRFGRGMKAYYYKGNRGVLLTTQGGKKYLVGSDHTERLAAIVDVARRMAGS